MQTNKLNKLSAFKKKVTFCCSKLKVSLCGIFTGSLYAICMLFCVCCCHCKFADVEALRMNLYVALFFKQFGLKQMLSTPFILNAEEP